jgi:hypothetical protein
MFAKPKNLNMIGGAGNETWLVEWAAFANRPA